MKEDDEGASRGYYLSDFSDGIDELVYYLPE